MKIEAENEILVPIDFSEFCANTVKYALHHFPVDKLRVIHVTQTPIVASYGAVEAISSDDILAECEREMQAFYEEYDIPTELKYVIHIGNPAERIAAFAKNNPVEAVLISSHGRTGVTRLFLGSVSEHVVRLAPCPVIVFKADEIQEKCREDIAKAEAAVS